MKRVSEFSAAAAFSALAVMLTPAPAQAAAEPVVGEIMTVAFDFCPRGWVEADGRTLPIAKHLPLFSLLGTKHGGDGNRTFAVPDLRGRTLVSSGGSAMRFCIATEGAFPARG